MCRTPSSTLKNARRANATRSEPSPKRFGRKRVRLRATLQNRSGHTPSTRRGACGAAALRCASSASATQPAARDELSVSYEGAVRVCANFPYVIILISHHLPQIAHAHRGQGMNKLATNAHRLTASVPVAPIAVNGIGGRFPAGVGSRAANRARRNAVCRADRAARGRMRTGSAASCAAQPSSGRTSSRNANARASGTTS